MYSAIVIIGSIMIFAVINDAVRIGSRCVRFFQTFSSVREDVLDGIFLSQVGFIFGEVAEWPMAAVLKTVDPQGSVSSNLTFSVFYSSIGNR